MSKFYYFPYNREDSNAETDLKVLGKLAQIHRKEGLESVLIDDRFELPAITRYCSTNDRKIIPARTVDPNRFNEEIRANTFYIGRKIILEQIPSDIAICASETA
jgi:hypothetical protein